jgi:hypothetical protein
VPRISVALNVPTVEPFLLKPPANVNAKRGLGAGFAQVHPTLVQATKLSVWELVEERTHAKIGCLAALLCFGLRYLLPRTLRLLQQPVLLELVLQSPTADAKSMRSFFAVVGNVRQRFTNEQLLDLRQ